MSHIHGGTTSPSTDFPQLVKSVTGANTIDIVGKNLFDFDKFERSSTATITGTYNNFTYKGASKTSYYYYNFKSNTQYHFSGIWSTTYGNFRVRIIYTNSDSTMLVQDYSSGTASGTINVNSSNTLTIQSIEFTTWTDGEIVLQNFQIEEGSATTQYEKPQSQSFELNLGKNILDNKNSNVSTNGLTFVKNLDGSITINGTATSDTHYYMGINNGSNIQKIDKLKTYTMSIGQNFPFNAFFRISDANSSGTFKQCQNAYGTNTNKVENIAGSFFTSGGIIAQIFVYNGQIANNWTVYPQLEESETASSYAPPNLPIKLLKNGDHQDYLYNNGGKWFKHKEVGKDTQNGNETWTLNSSTDDYYEFVRYGLTPVAVTGYINAYTEYFSNLTNNRCITNGQAIYIRVPASAGITTASDFTTWLGTHPTDVYYQLATPIEEEITDLVTLNYLNNLKYGAESCYGTTNITITSSELQPTIKVQTLDKIGG